MEQVMAYFKVIFQHVPVGSERTSVRIASVWTNTQSCDFLNMKQEC